MTFDSSCNVCFIAEAIFGMAPFASKTFEELQYKILDPKEIEVTQLPQ